MSSTETQGKERGLKCYKEIPRNSTGIPTGWLESGLTPFMSTKVALHSRLSLRSPWKATQLFWGRIKWRCWGGVWVSASESPYSYISQPRSLSQKGLLKEGQVWGATKGGKSNELCLSQGQLPTFLPYFFFFGAGGGTQVLLHAHQVLVHAYQMLMHTCRVLVHTCQVLLHACQVLVHACQMLVHTCQVF